MISVDAAISTMFHLLPVVAWFLMWWTENRCDLNWSPGVLCWIGLLTSLTMHHAIINVITHNKPVFSDTVCFTPTKFNKFTKL